MDWDPRPISIILRFDTTLQEITGSGEMSIFTSEGAPFLFLLGSIFDMFPEIEKKYPPGCLALTINDIPPTPQTVLYERDIVALSTGSKS
jgi:hypothetical protein